MKKVYLSGGTHTNWRGQVKAYFNGLNQSHPTVLFLEPLKLPYPLYKEYDIAMIDISDIVFAYMEPDNPSGLGLAAEIGYAVGKGVPVIFVNHKPEDRYLKFVEGMTPFHTDDWGYGMQELKRQLAICLVLPGEQNE